MPIGTQVGIKSMRESEKARFNVPPELGYGDAGDAGKGVPARSSLVYEVTLVNIIETVKLCDDHIVKRRLRKGTGWDRPREHAEVTAIWSGRLAASGTVFQPEREFTFTVGDPSLPSFWNLAVAHRMAKGETAELQVSPALGYGAEGAHELSVPPDADLLLTVTLVGWLSIDDISLANDRSALKRTLTKGDGWERARAPFECSIGMHVFRAPDAPSPDASADIVNVVIGEIARSAEIGEMGRACGGAELAAALELLLPQMQKHEVCELRCDPATCGFGCGDHVVPPSPLCMRVSMLGWVKVETVPHTGGAVLRRVVRESEDSDALTRPNEESTCHVRFTARAACASTAAFDTSGELLEATGEEGRTFTQGDGPLSGVLPCVDAAVREMKKGESAVVSAPHTWAYGSADWPRGHAASDRAVVVEVELVHFERAKEPYQMDGDERLAAQMKAKVKGNRLFAAGELKAAIRKYRQANERAPRSRDFSTLAQASADEVARRMAESSALTLSCHLNLAACHLKLEAGKEARAACDEALKLDPTSVKARFRRAQASAMMGECESAKADLLVVARSEPQNKEVRKELEAIQRRLSAEAKDAKAMFSKMF